MKYFVQYNNFKEQHWLENWNFNFVTFDYVTRVRTYVRPNDSRLREDSISPCSEHEKHQTKVVKYDN